MPTLPALDVEKNACFSPHVVILGAGASLAACPNGDRNGQRLPLMYNLVETVGLSDILQQATVDFEGRNFEDVYDHIAITPSLADTARALEDRIFEYFESLELPESVNLYDELLLSLRDKDLIATFNWDPFLMQAYERNRRLHRLPRAVFLHGNVAVGACREHRTKGYTWQRCATCDQPFPKTRLLYPVRRKNYSEDAFIRAEWDQLLWNLEHAYLLTIFGYGAPATDVDAKSMLRKAWIDNKTRELAEVFIVDIKPHQELEASWSEFFVRNHFGISPDLDGSWQFTFPRRSCDAFAMATLQNSPCEDRPMPRLQNLRELQDWVQPLIEAEDALDATGTPFDC